MKFHFASGKIMQEWESKWGESRQAMAIEPCAFWWVDFRFYREKNIRHTVLAILYLLYAERRTALYCPPAKIQQPGSSIAIGRSLPIDNITVGMISPFRSPQTDKTGRQVDFPNVLKTPNYWSKLSVALLIFHILMHQQIIHRSENSTVPLTILLCCFFTPFSKGP